MAVNARQIGHNHPAALAHRAFAGDADRVPFDGAVDHVLQERLDERRRIAQIESGALSRRCRASWFLMIRSPTSRTFSAR
ncbi:MAG: hypothetical protein EOQ55_15535 [Mesorhizobium sp.]|uniref:hypothetical protein n=1 Tax=unclassified Mesorhizobium TaxID=325217 RepID=UPI000FCBB08F|nr:MULTISPECIES: hypothetical protein [unclassified Mesorhizobium]RUV43610.1 hypothetical protein EOD29_10805 [Mesorhizobium sp. M1A.T.Ca.IN.004.03.1.1]RUV88635.1 hypothetical protein EOA75_24240 [Mesorhizobium sp. M1A.F.Ca.IN.022.07.1.1]RWG19395.1 MAG: hypothetical protein EOQ55_15535 [Mesorhizobium sp.]RWH23829.1 MAG: hypothetical protein EOQ76_21320 [Mesorhizobium sp.]RWH34724.1 MAG: hypothetical protein EOQ79_24130 [Mesorhizobium sp.]